MDEADDPTLNRPLQTAEPKPARHKSRRLIAVAAGTTIALGAGGIAYAATSAPTPTPNDSTPGTTTPDDEGTDQATPEHHPDGIEHHGPGGFVGFGGFGALHGEFVVETEDGTYETVATQRGTIDEITETSITVSSEDGYSATYVIDADALADTDDRGPMVDPADLAAGDEIVVMATVDGSTSTVQRLIDLANLPEPGAVRGFPGGPRGGMPPAPSDEAEPSTATS